MFPRKLSRARFFIGLGCLLLSHFVLLHTGDQPITYAQPTEAQKTRVRIFDIFGDQKGRAYVADGTAQASTTSRRIYIREDNRLTVYDHEGFYKPAESLTTQGRPGPPLIAANGVIAIIDDGMVYIEDAAGNRLDQFATNGRAVGIAPDHLFDVYFVFIDAKKVYLVNVLPEKVARTPISTTGFATVTLATLDGGPMVVITDDREVRTFNITGSQVGSSVPVQTDGRRARVLINTLLRRMLVIDLPSRGRVRLYKWPDVGFPSHPIGGPIRTSAWPEVRANFGVEEPPCFVVNVNNRDQGYLWTNRAQFSCNLSADAKDVIEPGGLVYKDTSIFFSLEHPHPERILPIEKAEADVELCSGRVLITDDAVRIRNAFGVTIRTIWTNGRAIVEPTPNCSRIVVIDLPNRVNNAPVLDSSGSPVLPAILEDETDNAGILVADLIASAGINMITDPDDNPFNTDPVLEGLAITDVDQSHGTWQFSTDAHRVRWQRLHNPSLTFARVLAADGHTRIRFVPAPNFTGTIDAAITFKAWDQTTHWNGGQATVERPGGKTAFSVASETASVTVTAVNDPPSFSKGADQTVRAVAGLQVIFNWATNITAGSANESDQVVHFVVANDNNGLFVRQPALTSDGTLIYEPAPAASGTANVSVVLNDDGGTAHGGINQSPPQTFIITVLPNDGTPVAIEDRATTAVDTAVIIPVLDNDIEPNGDPMSVVGVSSPVEGTAVTDGTTITYTPTGGFVGVDTFTYTLSDGGLTDIGTVIVMVGPVNQAPILDNTGTPALTAIDEDEVSNNGTSIRDLLDSVLPLDLITDPDSGALEGIAIIDVDEGEGDWQFSTDNGGSWSDVGSPTATHGRLLAANASTRLRFVPDLNFHGVVDAGVTFRAWDQSSGSNGGTANAIENGGLTPFSAETETATLVVNPVNDPPTAAPDTANTANNTARAIAVLGNDSDLDGDILTVTAVGLPDNGAATGNADGTILYEPLGFTGTAVFTYTIQDSGSLTDTALVTVQVGSANVAPVAGDDFSRTFEGTAAAIHVLNNDSDADGDTLIISQVGEPDNGTTVILNGTAVIYTPLPGFSGSDVFTYTVSDGDLFDTAMVMVTVAGPANDFWEKDLFDNLIPTDLHGQNGWAKVRPDRASPVVVAGDGPGDQILKIDPTAGQTIVMEKDVLDQRSGRHTFTVLVKVTGPVDLQEPTLAKIEFGTIPNQGWGKKFQLYFGASMRVNYGPASGDAELFIPNTVLDQWYRLQVDMDLANDSLDLSVDGVQVLTGIPMHPGPLTSLGISGWDRPGAVFLDDLLGWQAWDNGPVGMCGLSTFDAGDEGWRVIGDAQDNSIVPDFHITGGNPGGYISATDDVLGGVWYWVAPDKFLGSQIAAYNDTLAFDLRQSLTSNQFPADDVILGGGGIELAYKLPGHPGTDWTSYAVILNEGEGWVNRDTRNTATFSEMQTVLAGLEKLHIRGEYRSGDDVGSLDNVSLDGGCPQTGKNIYWINPNGGDMADPSNWSTNAVPTLADHAFITLNGNYTVTHRTSTHPVAMEFGTLTIGSDPTIMLDADSAVNSLIHVDNTLVNHGRIIMQNSGPSDPVRWAWIVLEDGSLENYGVIDLLTGQGSDHEIFSDIVNEGVFNQETGLIYSGQFVNRHLVKIAENQELLISDPLEELSSFSQEDGSITGLGTLVVNNQASLIFTRGVNAGPPAEVSDGYLIFGPDPSGVASFILHEGSVISGNIGVEQTVQIGEERGQPYAAAINGDLINDGVILMAVGENTAVSSLDITGGTLTNRGDLLVSPDGGGERRLQGDVLNRGRFDLNLNNFQEIELVDSQFVNAPSGSISGMGTVDLTDPGSSLINEGLIQPENDSGTGMITLQGDLIQTASGTVLIDIVGPADTDEVHITGTAAFDGTLAISLLNGFQPVLGEQFEVIGCRICNGTFSHLASSPLGDNLAFKDVYNPDNVTLTVIEENDAILFLPFVYK